MKNYELLILKLENDKWYIYPAEKNISEEQVKKDGPIIYEFIQSNPVIEIEKRVLFFEEYEIDGYVKKYMKLYGIENVRGGSYSDLNIPTFMVRTIEREHRFTLASVENDQEILKSIKEEYNDITLLKTQSREINEKIKAFTSTEPINLSKKYKKYMNILIKLNQLDEMSLVIFEDIEWILKKIEESKYEIIKEADKQKYKSIVKDLQTVYKLYCILKNEPNEYNIKNIDFGPLIYLKSPNVVLDWFFLHRYKELNIDVSWEYYEKNAVDVLKQFEYMAYVIKNRKDELEFDHSCYPSDFIKRYNMTLSYISKN